MRARAAVEVPGLHIIRDLGVVMPVAYRLDAIGVAVLPLGIAASALGLERVTGRAIDTAAVSRARRRGIGTPAGTAIAPRSTG
ncbi:hypothetical protein BHD05_14635 [Marisediminicola antarctica]|uniref:Uncharacterized protein n=1 Tax=Marisediminicola antarctica TaxID=674079 RepID=A0A7L5AJB1_9MICO|nr:hypothetical protein BHD05_14635 [Marisediminicola antarctica]